VATCFDTTGAGQAAWVRLSFGYVFQLYNQSDPRNISAKLREGYEPVRIEEQPQFQLFIDPNSRFKDNIEVAGLLLCKVPEDFMEQKELITLRKIKTKWNL
jgi:hypothetical protein